MIYERDFAQIELENIAKTDTITIQQPFYDKSTLSIRTIGLSVLESKIDESIRKSHGWYPWEEALIDGEYSVEIRNMISERYKAAGWTYVYHRTSSENNERPGLTCFKFSKTPINPKYTKNYHEV